jgi:hypothetical protein
MKTQKKEVQINVPKDWSAVTLKDYLAFRKDVEAYKDEPEALVACLFHHLCHFPVEYIHKLDMETYTAIKDNLLEFIGKVDYPLQRFITIDGVEYGFEPDLSKIAYGAYVDISKYDSVGVDKNWANVMSILYRPVVSKSKSLYEIQPYEAIIDGDKFMDVNMDVHFGAVFFFNSLLKDLLSTTLSSLTQESGLQPNIKSILEKNGNLIHQLSSSPTAILQNLMK